MERFRMLVLTVLVSLAAGVPPVLAQDTVAVNPDADQYALPPAEVQEILRTDRNWVQLDYLSPDGDHFLVPVVTDLSTLELMSRPTYRLAELEIRPATDRLWELDTHGIYDLRFYSLSRRAFTEVDLPEGTFVSDLTWSPDGSRVAFLAHLPGGTEVWTADPATGRTARVSDARVMATLATDTRGQGSRPSSMLQWTPQGTLLTLLVPPGRGAEPARDPVPDGPIVRRTREQPTGNPTYPYLLEDEHDARLFEHYTTSQLAELAPGRGPVLLGEPRMYESISVSPDGRHVMARFLERPFSYITSYDGFPSRTVVLARDGALVAALDRTPLREGRTPGGSGRGGGGSDPRSFSWRPDGAGLAFLQRAPRPENGEGDSPRMDRALLASAPFDLTQAQVVLESEEPMGSVTYSLDGRHAFATVTRSGESALVHYGLEGAEPARTVLVDFHSGEDPTERPGELFSQRTGNGLEYALVSSAGDAAYLRGEGLKADFRPQPFVDRVALADGATTRIFEGATTSFDRPLVALDPDLERMIVSREGVHDFPDSFLWSEGGMQENLTENVDPFPEITAVRRMDFEFTRRDGLTVRGRVSLPVGYREGERVPAVFWTYPREYTTPERYERAAIERRNRNAFTRMSWLRWSDIWLSRGYALVDPDIPIVGENYNDTYIANLVDAMYGAIRAVDELGVVDIDRIGHGGHSYGAFATANILANAPFFKAGIAGDGAYNRTLTPDGFQSERRNLWEAPHTYTEMSPFFRADQIDTPLLMYHGGDDNNTGTFPVQSRRMISALTILGKTAVLYEYPYESHTPRAMENKLDMWARFFDWFDRYVKNAELPAAVVSDGPEG